MASGMARELTTPAPGVVPGAAGSSLAELKAFLGRIDARVTAIEAVEPSAPVSLPSLAPVSTPPAFPADSYVMNRESGSFHRTTSHSDAPPSEQRTICGWTFGLRRRGNRGDHDFSRFLDIPSDTPWTSICPKCCKWERDLKKACADSDVE